MKKMNEQELENVNGGGFLDQLALEGVTFWKEMKEGFSSLTWKDVGEIILYPGDDYVG